MFRHFIVIAVFMLRKLRRFFGLPVLDLTDATSPISVDVRNMEKPPKKETAP